MILAITSVVLSSGLYAIKNEPQAQQTASTQIVSFARPEGTVRVYLPADIRPGDTISGTVISEAAGKNEKELTRNSALLEGMVVDVQGSAKKGSGAFGFAVPATTSTPLPLALRNASGKSLSTFKLPVYAGWPVATPITSPGPQDFCIPPIAQTGNLFPIAGSFDGKSASTALKLGSEGCTILAESPRTSIAVVPRASIGAQTAELKEMGFTAVAPVHCLKVTLSTPSSTLLKGQQSTISVRVTGLAGLADSAYPIPFQFTNLSPGQIRMGNGSTIARVLITQSSAVSGSWTSSVPILASVDGPFQVQGTIYFDFNDDRKAKLPAKAVNAWIAHLTENFEKEIKEKENDASKKTRVEILRKVVSNLKAVKVTDNNALERGASLRAVDAQLDLISFLDVGSALVGVAADMLGYTDLPLQSILDILQAIKDLNIVSDNGLLEKAIGQTAVGIGIQDAKKKLGQIQKIRDALKELQDSIQKQIG